MAGREREFGAAALANGGGRFGFTPGVVRAREIVAYCELGGVLVVEDDVTRMCESWISSL